MKLRNGFVSNSSSSSFTCEICGNTETVYDGSFLDSGFYRCQNTHIICQEEAIAEENKDIELIEDDYEGTCLDSKNCPICQFKCISNEDVAEYLLKEKQVSRDEVFAEIKKINKRRRVLRDNEYVQYVCKKFNLTEDMILDELKTKFGDYSKVCEYIKRVY